MIPDKLYNYCKHSCSLRELCADIWDKNCGHYRNIEETPGLMGGNDPKKLEKILEISKLYLHKKAQVHDLIG